MWNAIEHVAENQRLDLATAQQVAAEKASQYGINNGMINTWYVDDFIKEVRQLMEAAGIPNPPHKWAAGQSQDSTFDQLTRLLLLANKNGLYDAANWLQAELTRWSSRWKRGSFQKLSYVSHCKGHRNSEGELAEWCVKSHKDDHIISSHGTEAAAKKHLQDMHAHSGATKKADVYDKYDEVFQRHPDVPYNYESGVAMYDLGEEELPRPGDVGVTLLDLKDYGWKISRCDSIVGGKAKETILAEGKTPEELDQALTNNASLFDMHTSSKKAFLLQRVATPWANDFKHQVTITPEEYYGCSSLREIWGDYMGIPRLKGVNDRAPGTPSAARRRLKSGSLLLNKLGRDALDILNDHAYEAGRPTSRKFFEDLKKKYEETTKKDPESVQRRKDYEDLPPIENMRKRSDDEEDNPECFCHHRFYDHDEQGICDICEAAARITHNPSNCPGFDPIRGDHKVFLGSFEQNDNVLKQSGTSRFLTIAECKQAFHDKVADAGGHYVWEANGDQAIIISPDHDMRVLRYEDAQPFWETLFGLEEQTNNPDELQKAIDDVCAKYFETPVDPTTYFYEAPKTSADNYDPNATGYTNEPHDSEDHQQGSRSHIGNKPKTPGALHNRIEKASETLAALWPKAPKAAQRGYAITHHLNSVQMLLKEALGQIVAYPELASQKISTAENTLRTAADTIKHLKL